jgi:hypothetical protein
MSDLLPNNPPPQFSVAEFGNTPSGDICKMCQKPITGVYYRANGVMVCDSCGDRVKRGLPQDSHAGFAKAVLFGLGGFVAGLTIYAGFSIATGIQIGYLSLAVGWLIGKAMMMGSGNIGGRRYQIAAVILTYAAVSMAAIPIALHYQSPTASSEVRLSAKTGEASDSKPSANSAADDTAGDTGSKAESRSPLAVFAGALLKLALIGLASPFLELSEGAGGIIGLVILFVGMRFAWRMTAAKTQMAVEGPYQVSTPKASGASA